MNADELMLHYERVADSPHAVGRLRTFVLELAVRGKLVPQDASDESAQRLLARMATERARKVAAGQLRLGKAQEIDAPECPFELPESWAWAALGNVFVYDAGAKCEPTALDPKLWLVELEDVEKDTGRLLARLRVCDRESQSTKSEFRRGDVLYGKLRPYLNKVLVADEPGYSTTEIVALRPYIPLCAGYCALALRRPDFVEYVTRVGQGTKMPRLRSDDAVIAPFPVPPLPEQHRIVAKVDELMTLCDRLEAARAEREAARDRLAAATLARLNAPDPETFADDARFALDALPALTARPDQIKQIREGILNLAARGMLVAQVASDNSAMQAVDRARQAKALAFESEGLRGRGPISSPKRDDLAFGFPDTWALACFDDVFVIVSGVTKGQKVATDQAIDVPYLRVANVQRGHLDLSVIKTITVRVADTRRYALKPGDILMTEGGDWDKLGRAAIWHDEIAGCIHQNHVFRVRTGSSEISPEWVRCYVNSPLGRAFFENAAKQTTNLASINLTQLRSCPLPLPPPDEQHRIVARVAELMAICDELESSLMETEAHRSRLLEALLRNALESGNHADAQAVAEEAAAA